MTNTIRDITQESDVIMLVGSNPEEAHPVLGMQLRQAVRQFRMILCVNSFQNKLQCLLLVVPVHHRNIILSQRCLT